MGEAAAAAAASTRTLSASLVPPLLQQYTQRAPSPSFLRDPTPTPPLLFVCVSGSSHSQHPFLYPPWQRVRPTQARVLQPRPTSRTVLHLSHPAGRMPSPSSPETFEATPLPSRTRK